MPRATRNSATGSTATSAAPLGLRAADQRLNVNAAPAKPPRDLTGLKRKAVASGLPPTAAGSKAAKKVAAGGGGKGRAALGEITNAFVETKSQAKKGLTKMISKSKSSLTRQASLRKAKSDTSKVNAAVPSVNAAASKAKKQREKDDVAEEEEDDDEVFISGATRSLPASQEVVSIKEPSLEEEAEEESDTDEYESADEGADEPEQAKVVAKASPLRKRPDNVADFDAEHADDPHAVSEYAAEIFQYYKNREAQFRVPDYLSSVQTDLTLTMRSILVDWLVEVQESFELNHETLYTSVKLLDLYLSRVPRVDKGDLQLIGATACLIACKIDERIPPLLEDFVYVCDDAYKKEAITQKEIEMIAVVGFDVGFPLSYRFLRRYGRVCSVSMKDLTFARFILELSLMEYTLNVETSESQLAAAALMLVCKLVGLKDFEDTLAYYSGYAMKDLVPLAKRLHNMLITQKNELKRTIRTKYEHAVFHSVASKPIPKEISFDY